MESSLASFSMTRETARFTASFCTSAIMFFKKCNRIIVHQWGVVLSDPAENVIAIKGPVPGPNGSTVILKIESLPDQK